MLEKVDLKGKPAFGTNEWASSNVNIISGCIGDCLYCFAKGNAVRFKRKTADNWKIEEVKPERLKKNYRKRKGTIMFPSSHDISPKNTDNCIFVLEKMLKAGNNVLIVSKPHLAVTEKLCTQLQQYQKQILFRFTIGSLDNDTLKFWEPNAPSFEERLVSLKYAFNQGYRTSVSCEPALDGNVEELVQRLFPYITDTLWIGKANKLKANLKLNGHGDSLTRKKAEELQKIQSDKWVFDLYEQLADNPKVRWKDSFKEILGIERPTQVGLDM